MTARSIFDLTQEEYGRYRAAEDARKTRERSIREALRPVYVTVAWRARSQSRRLFCDIVRRARAGR